ncbi:hypothetical protein VPH35_002485 [Triticum aestivum]
MVTTGMDPSLLPPLLPLLFPDSTDSLPPLAPSVLLTSSHPLLCIVPVASPSVVRSLPLGLVLSTTGAQVPWHRAIVRPHALASVLSRTPSWADDRHPSSHQPTISQSTASAAPLVHSPPASTTSSTHSTGSTITNIPATESNQLDAAEEEKRSAGAGAAQMLCSAFNCSNVVCC